LLPIFSSIGEATFLWAAIQRDAESNARSHENVLLLLSPDGEELVGLNFARRILDLKKSAPHQDQESFDSENCGGGGQSKAKVANA
jgi:hypothetical protein